MFMCRLFGFRSVIQSQVHQSLIHAENALALQSERHPDGWGVAFYRADAPHIIRSVSTAINDSLFTHVSGLVSSKTVLAHLRKATVGGLGILNTHPFQYGRWVFAHNGTLDSSKEVRNKLRAQIHPDLNRFILGDTDSEILFYLILSRMQMRRSLDQPLFMIDEVANAIQESAQLVAKTLKNYEPKSCFDETKGSSFSFILTNGTLLIGHHGGQELYYSTYKNQCSERQTCPYFAKSCENEVKSGKINHLLIASEPLQGENIWVELKPKQMVAVDHDMQLSFWEAS